MSEDQLTAILLTEFPDNLSLAESRERLEMEITLIAIGDGIEDMEDGCVWISPYWIHRVLCKRARDERIRDARQGKYNRQF